MVIHQGSRYNLRKIKKYLNRHTPVLKLDNSLIESDIHKLNRIEETLSKHNITDNSLFDTMRKYLNKLLKTKSDIELEWKIKDNSLKSVPFQFTSVSFSRSAEINMVDYITLNPNENLISIDITELLSLIAFDLVHRDLGITDREIEEHLKGKTSILGVNDSSCLLDIYIDNDFFRMATSLRISNSKYLDTDNKSINTYFGHSIKNTTDYSDVLKATYEYTYTLILEHILGIIHDRQFDMQLVSYSNGKIYIIDKGNTVVFNDLLDIDLVIFGRTFRIKSNISVY